MVSNYSFEKIDSLSPFYDHFFHTSWIQTEKKKDAVMSIECADSWWQYSVGRHWWNPEVAKTGTRVAEISIYPHRRFLATQMCSPMIKNQEYRISFWVRPHWYTKKVTSSIGMAFFNDSISLQNFLLSPDVYPTTPAIENPKKRYIREKEWYEIKGTYTAQGGELYCVIGNLKSVKKTPLKRVLINKADYISLYIDDVEVSPVDGSIPCPNPQNRESTIELNR